MTLSLLPVLYFSAEIHDDPNNNTGVAGSQCTGQMTEGPRCGACPTAPSKRLHSTVVGLREITMTLALVRLRKYYSVRFSSLRRTNALHVQYSVHSRDSGNEVQAPTLINLRREEGVS